MKTWLEGYVKTIVTQPDEVTITQSEGQLTRVLHLKVAQDDIGRVKGRRGRMIRALESMTELTGRHDRIRYVLDLEG